MSLGPARGGGYGRTCWCVVCLRSRSKWLILLLRLLHLHLVRIAKVYGVRRGLRLRLQRAILLLQLLLCFHDLEVSGSFPANLICWNALFLVSKMVHEIVIRVPKVGIVRPSEHLLDLLMVYLIKATQLVLLEAEGG